MASAEEMPGFQAVSDFLIAERGTIEGLAEADRRLAVLGCLLAVDPASAEIGAFFQEAIAEGVSRQRLETALVHAIGYLGAIRIRAAHRQLAAALTEAGLIAGAAGKASIPRDRRVRVETGTRLYDRFDPGRPVRPPHRSRERSELARDQGSGGQGGI